MNPKELTFEDTIIEEGSWGERVIGKAKCKMTLYDEPSQQTRPHILWEIEYEGEGDENEPDEEAIGLELEGKKVIGYDGLMSIPAQAIQLLKQNGYDTSEVED